MGDRANIYLVDTDDAERGIYLYTHWHGSQLPELLKQALVFGKGRWHDETYLARIIVSQVVQGHDELTGWGLSTMLTDNEYPIIVVDLVNHQVAFAPAGAETDRNRWSKSVGYDTYVQGRAQYAEVA